MRINIFYLVITQYYICMLHHLNLAEKAQSKVKSF